MSEAHVTADGAALWTTVHGSGSPLLLCHGGPGLWDDLDIPARAVEDLVTVYRFEQRGCGRSEDAGPYTVERAIADIEVLREQWGIERWIVGGHSWGAALAMAYALAHPQPVRAVVWISGTGVDDYWEREGRARYGAERSARLAAEQRGRLDDLRQMRSAAVPGTKEWAVLDEELCVLQWLPDFADRDRAPDLAAALLEPGFRPNYAANAALNADWRRYRESERPAERLADFAAPTLVIHGAEDPRPPNIARRLAATLPRADLKVIEGAGHFPWVERPNEFAAALRAFVAEAS